MRIYNLLINLDHVTRMFLEGGTDFVHLIFMTSHASGDKRDYIRSFKTSEEALKFLDNIQSRMAGSCH